MKKPLNEMCCQTAALKEGYSKKQIQRSVRLRCGFIECLACRPSPIEWIAENPKPSAMDEATKVVNGDRQEDYGDAKESFERIASLWSPLLGTPVTAKQVALCMIALKLSRATTSDKHDTVVDIIGYGICLEKIMEVKKP